MRSLNYGFDSASELVIKMIIIIRVFCPKAGLSLQIRHQDCSCAERQIFHYKLKNQGCNVLLGMYKGGSFPLISAPHSLFSI